MDCSQSSSSVVTLYNYQPIVSEEITYLLGNSTRIENYCWPGFSPFYSYFYQYPSNLDYVITQVWTALTTLSTDIASYADGAGYAKEAPPPPPKSDRTFLGIDYMNISYWLVD